MAHSGKWLMRVPKTLHARLARRAEVESVSLNLLAATLLAEGLGARTAMAPRRAGAPLDTARAVLRDAAVRLPADPGRMTALAGSFEDAARAIRAGDTEAAVRAIARIADALAAQVEPAA
jgi:hypothetical protein